MSETNQNMVQITDLRFAWGNQANPVINIPEFHIARGEHLFLQGPSGSGKTTLLSLIAAVLSPQSGSVVIDNINLDTLRRSQKDQFRVDHIGLVFQQFNLLPFLSVEDNVQLSCRFSKTRKARAGGSKRALDEETDRLLDAMMLNPNTLRHRHTSQLSVGQQQRVAVARALIGSPPLIIADEPTSSLDSDSRQAFLELLFSETKNANSTLLFVSHDANLASAFDRHVNLTTVNKVPFTLDRLGETR